MAAKRNFRSKSKQSTNKRARRLVECSPHRTTGGGFFPGLTDDDVEHESYNERYALSTLVLCHDVTSIASQASREPSSNDDDSRHHIPDFTVDAFVPGLRIEVKALASLVHEGSIEKYLSVAKSYLSRGIPFAFIVDAQLEEAPRFDSVKLLVRYATSGVPEAVLARATECLSDGPLSIDELTARASLELVDVLTLIARRHLCFDWAIPLHPKTTVVSLPGQPFGGLRLEDILRSTRFGRLLEDMAVGRRPTDKYVLADAATWRQHHRPLGPWSFVGGFQDTSPLRDLGEEECIPRAIKRKRDRAPGLSPVADNRPE